MVTLPLPVYVAVRRTDCDCPIAEENPIVLPFATVAAVVLEAIRS
jgi:hypothetical protein